MYIRKRKSFLRTENIYIDIVTSQLEQQKGRERKYKVLIQGGGKSLGDRNK